MKSSLVPQISPLRRNPVFWIMWALPASAVCAGLATLAIALRDGDVALPAAYHWEGARLDEDFARARVAAGAGIELAFEARPHDQRCVASLFHAPGDPAALHLQLTHGSSVDLDRTLRLPRIGRGQYAGECAEFPAGRWRVAVDDDSHAWSLRGTADGTPLRFTLRARDPDGARP